MNISNVSFYDSDLTLHSGALGAGLAIFSKFPIIATAVHPYSLNGAPMDVAAGDWFVGKAAASVVILHPVLGQVQIFNTHVSQLLTIYNNLTNSMHDFPQLFAKGGEDGPEYNRAHRLVNAWEFAKLARQAAEMGRYVIAVSMPIFLFEQECSSFSSGRRFQQYSHNVANNCHTRACSSLRFMARHPPDRKLVVFSFLTR